MKRDPIPQIVGEPDADPATIPESIVQDIWRLQQFRNDDLQTVDGRRLVILDPGKLNDYQGPDFLNARIVVGSTSWAGSIEIHRTSADWIRHRHHEDPHYRAVVLHVTLIADRHTGRLKRADGSLIPEIVLLPRLRDSLRKLQWQFRKGGQLFFACHEHWLTVPDSTIASFLERLAADRLRRKASRLGERFLSLPDLDQILFEEVLRCLGYSQNAEAMVLLARRVPLKVLHTIPDPRDAAALMLGSAGLLEARKGARSPADPLDEMRQRFDDLGITGGIIPLPVTIWRHGRLRPANSPRRRILQATLLFGRTGPIGRHPVDTVVRLLDSDQPQRVLRSILNMAPDIEAYLESAAASTALRLGQDQRITIAANAFLPILILRAEQTESSDDLERAVAVLHKLPVVMDHIVRRYSADRGRPVSSAVTQGLHELSRSWCGQGRCRECPIWKHIARPSAIVRKINP